MHSYSVRDVERVLQLSRSTIQGLIDGGFVKPARGPRRQYQFSFQDLIVLRAARALTQAKVSRKRIHKALKELRRELPETMPLSGISITAVGDRVVVREGKSRWQVDDGQYVLGLDVSVDEGELHVVEVPAPDAIVTSALKPASSGPDPTDSEVWFATGVELEQTDPRKAQEAYERAVAADPAHLAAWTNWGRLAHEQGQLKKAENIYRARAESRPGGLGADVQSRRRTRRPGSHACRTRGLSVRDQRGSDARRLPLQPGAAL